MLRMRETAARAEIVFLKTAAQSYGLVVWQDAPEPQALWDTLYLFREFTQVSYFLQLQGQERILRFLPLGAAIVPVPGRL